MGNYKIEIRIQGIRIRIMESKHVKFIWNIVERKRRENISFINNSSKFNKNKRKQEQVKIKLLTMK